MTAPGMRIREFDKEALEGCREMLTAHLANVLKTHEPMAAMLADTIECLIAAKFRELQNGNDQ